MLLFIRVCWIVWLTHPGFSIHLMLLFIPITGFLDGINIEFQYISCYCLSSSILLSISLTHISIHLMLLFIMSGPRLKFQLNFISIHLMLLFIYIQPSQGILLYKFQYISCYCLSLWLVTVVSFVRISIHLMLLFISLAKSDWSLFALFQYISCYCLSWLQSSDCCHLPGFQYISCYCLSQWSDLHPPVPSSFQYISCYCLSLSQTLFASE